MDDKHPPNATGHLAQDLRPEKRYKLLLGGRLCFPWIKIIIGHLGVNFESRKLVLRWGFIFNLESQIDWSISDLEPSHFSRFQVVKPIINYVSIEVSPISPQMGGQKPFPHRGGSPRSWFVYKWLGLPISLQRG